MEKHKKESLKRETVWLLLVISLFCGIALGYGWRMSQVQNTERAIVEALRGCNQLITDELVIQPTKDCERLKTAIMGLKSRTFNYTRGD